MPHHKTFYYSPKVENSNIILVHKIANYKNIQNNI